MDKPFGLTKSMRLCERRDIDTVFNQANAVRHPLMVLLGRRNGLHYPRLAIIVAKKNIKKANDRNRVKRLIRESFRHNQQAIAGHDLVIIIKKGFDCASNPEIFTLLEKQWAKFLKRYSG